jgi:exonuclease SbcC
MKILKLHFKNIHSLKGVHTIDFTAVPLSYAGLFAITGPTGAGKSTILDVITLALFSRIPRFEKKITNAEIEKMGSVMTHFSDQAFAEIEYQTSGKYYRSTWMISKTRNNTLKDYEMRLARLHPEEFLDLKTSEVPAENERIIGLNYEQFVRSILLSQGEFAKFLRSDKTERTSLLEDITGSQIYRELGKAAFEKAKIKREEISKLTQQKDAIPILTDDEILDKQHTLTKNQADIQECEKKLQESIHWLAIMEKKLQIQQKIGETEKLGHDLQKKQTNFESQYQRLQKHQNLDIYRSEITLWQHDKSQWLSTLNELENSKQKIAFHQNLLDESLRKMAVFTHQEINEENFLSEMKKFENFIIHLDNNINRLKEKGTKCRHDFNQLLKKYSHSHTTTIAQLSGLTQQIQYCTKHLKDLDQRPLIPDSDELLVQKISETRKQIQLIEHQYFTALKYEECKQKIEQSYAEKEKNIHEQKVVTLEIETLKVQLDQAKIEASALQKHKEEQFKINSLEEHRIALIDNEPCPLCGALHHPYAKEKNWIEIGQTEEKIMKLQASIDANQKDLLKRSEALASLHTYVRTLDEQIASNNSMAAEMEKSWPEIAHPDSASEKLKILTEKLKMAVEKLEAEVTSRQWYLFFTDCLHLLNELTQTADAYITCYAERQKYYTGHDINGDADKIQNQFISARDVCHEWTTTHTNHQKTLLRLEESIQNREKNLLPNLIHFGYGDISTAQMDILDDQTLQQIIFDKEKLTKEYTEWQNTHQNLIQELQNLPDVAGHEIEQLRSAIHQLNLEKEKIILSTGGITKELEKNSEAISLIKEAEAIIKKKSDDAHKWYLLDRLIGDATGNKYARYAQNLSLKYLITLANRRLCKLTDRYLLVHTDIEADLTIQDLYQGNIKRSVKTLSGGESFIVSLALALSLSDMASQNVRLESLFIDEGFGSLDAETLETAIETLERLQSDSNRIIGIISHVDSLKERITTQIKVHKGSGGYSTLEVTT